MSVPHQYIAIEGNIGAGKTTLCHMLANDFNCKLVLEEFAENPFLPHFYQDPGRYAFPVELFFLTERHKQLEKHLLRQDLFFEFIVSDYFFLKTLLFAKNNLNPDEYRIFQKMYFVLAQNFPNPDMLLYLHRSPNSLLQYIRSRGRGYEKSIDTEYLYSLQNSYFEYFRSELTFPIVILDADNLDFVNNPKDYQEIKDIISQKFQPGIHRVSLLH